MASMTITSKGQVTIPKAVRDQMGLRGGDKVRFVEKDGKFVLEKDVEESPFDKWVGYLTHLKGRKTDEIMEELRRPKSSGRRCWGRRRISAELASTEEPLLRSTAAVDIECPERSPHSRERPDVRCCLRPGWRRLAAWEPWSSSDAVRMPNSIGEFDGSRELLTSVPGRHRPSGWSHQVRPGGLAPCGGSLAWSYSHAADRGHLCARGAARHSRSPARRAESPCGPDSTSWRTSLSGRTHSCTQTGCSRATAGSTRPTSQTSNWPDAYL